MISVILAAGYATRMYPLTENYPKPLLEIGGRSILQRLMEDIDKIEAVERHVVVSNHRFIDFFEDWARRCALTKPVTVLDDGTTDNAHRRGAVVDVRFAIDSLRLEDALLVAAGDNILDFSLAGFVDYAASIDASCVMCYREDDENVLKRSGVLVPEANFRVREMVEKPALPPSHWATPPFYVYHKRDVPNVARAIAAGINTDAPGSFIAWLAKESTVFAYPMPGKRYDVGDLQGYDALRARFS